MGFMLLLEKIFLEIWNLGKIGTVVILAVALLRLCLRSLPKKFSYVLWAIPALRLLVPISFRGLWELPAGLVRLAVQSAPRAADGMRLPLDGTGQTAALPDFGAPPDLAAGAALMQPPDTSGREWLLALACVWLAGVVFLAVRGAYRYCRLRRRLCVSVEWGPHIYLADGIAQPFVLAGFPGRIYLPSDLDDERRRYVLLHEQVHVKRGDAFFKLLASAIACIHWYNPAVWLGVYLFNRDMEMSCDEAAALGLDASGRRAYALALLHFSVGKGRWTQLPCAFTERGVKGRIMNLSKEKKKSRAAVLLAGALVLLAAVVLVPDFYGEGSGSGEKDALSERRAYERTETGGASPEGESHERTETGGALPENASHETTKKTYAADVMREPDESDDVGVRESSFSLDGVPVSLRWQEADCSAGEMETLALLVYEKFAETYLAGNRGPEQAYRLDGISCDFEPAGDLVQMFSETDNAMIWRLFVTLPDNWREDKGMGMMQDEENQQQEYDVALTQNAAGSWEVAECAWRAYYDAEGRFRW